MADDRAPRPAAGCRSRPRRSTSRTRPTCRWWWRSASRSSSSASSCTGWSRIGRSSLVALCAGSAGARRCADFRSSTSARSRGWRLRCAVAAWRRRAARSPGRLARNVGAVERRLSDVEHCRHRELAVSPAPAASALRGVAPSGTSHVAPSSVQQRTMSRIDSTPTISPPSTTTRWRKPPRTISSAARSSDQSGAAKIRCAERWSWTLLGVGALPGADRVEDVALGDDPRAGLLGIDHDGRAHAALGHLPRGLAQRVVRADRQHHRAHSLANLHRVLSLLRQVRFVS